MSSTIQIAETAEQAFVRYQAAFSSDALIQSNWHSVADDGRQLACALGVLGSSVNGPRDCPAQIMPRWLAQMVPTFFDSMEFEAAKAWGLEFYAELKRLNGQVPFSVVHDWQANVVGPLGVDWRTKKGVSLDAINTLTALHSRAQRGDVVPRAEWYEALRPALREVYLADANAYAYADAYANADADAYANADADANAYADAYANAYAYADANAYADADAYADAYANADADANAYANAKFARRQEAYARLANGMVECLRRVQSAEPAQ